MLLLHEMMIDQLDVLGFPPCEDVLSNIGIAWVVLAAASPAFVHTASSPVQENNLARSHHGLLVG